jgi:hypothetical protein
VTAQLALPLRDALSQRYARWRASDEGERVFEAVAVRAIALARSGAKRVEVNLLVAQTRGALKIHCDNSYRSRISDELLDRYPELRGKIETRRRTAA